MKLANVSWGWTPIPEDMPHGDSLIRIADQIRELGFDYDEPGPLLRDAGEHLRGRGLSGNPGSTG